MKCILAQSVNGVIGNKGKLPWPKIKSDMKHFVEVTKEHKIMIMGRNTWESLPGILPDRTHVIVSKNEPKGLDNNCVWYNNIENALSDYSNGIIIGGAKLIESAMSSIDYLYLTTILHPFSGDVLCPNILGSGSWVRGITEFKYDSTYPLVFQQFKRD